MTRPRSEILDTAPAVHGGPSGRLDECFPVRIDFSASINACGPADVVREAILGAPLDVYPDPECLRPRRAAGERWSRPLGEIAFGAGAAEFIYAVCFAFLRPNDPVLIAEPTFGEYGRSAALCGARLLRLDSRPPDYSLDAGSIAQGIVEGRPRLAFVCSPNNPTGQVLTREGLGAIASACASAGTLLVLDQAYDAFASAPLGPTALPGGAAVLHLRSITKDHALAGVRAAFALGPPGVIEAIERARVPWSASTAAQAAAVASLSDAGIAHARVTIAQLRAERERLQQAFARLGIRTVPSDTHFFLAEVGDAPVLRDRLLIREGIKVRDCTSFGLPRHIRVAARTPSENNALLSAIEAACST